VGGSQEHNSAAVESWLPERIMKWYSRVLKWSWTNSLVFVDPDIRTQQGPLNGISVSVKDIFEVKHMRSSAGSLVLFNNIPDRDSYVVDQLRQAGAAIIGKANCSEFGIGIDTETRIGGRVLHPTLPNCSPGGSSGGDAVAVATGMSDLGVATDYGGSVRWPAQSVGVCGLRTTPGLIPRVGRLPGTILNHGELNRCGIDPTSLQHELEVVSFFARNPMLIASILPYVAPLRNRYTSFLRKEELTIPGSLRIAYSYGESVSPIRVEVKLAIDSAIEKLSNYCKSVQLIRDPFAGGFEIYSGLRKELDKFDDLERIVRGKEALLCDTTLEALRAKSKHSFTPNATEITKLKQGRKAFEKSLEAVKTQFDVIIYPVAPVARTSFNGSWNSPIGTISGDALMAHCRAVSLSKWPSLSVPTSVHPLYGPASVQVICAPGHDLLCCLIGNTIFDDRANSQSMLNDTLGVSSNRTRE
jgi:amidase